ncbi:hypothetical protein MLD38_021638 [Melastoma candidum]|uniref:Uncharacterized protein n=1 Tax=Melastoma candidum TaxID=119954 RepID=A0ACB9QKK7_9MYRT|nr:hypothetical protein MLD38_021638 [Melastoma candidum]
MLRPAVLLDEVKPCHHDEALGELQSLQGFTSRAEGVTSGVVPVLSFGQEGSPIPISILDSHKVLPV